VTPKEGYEDTTPFSFRASNWAAQYAPINYCFKYIRNDGEERTIRGLQSSEFYSTTLTAGSYIIKLTVCDKYNTCVTLQDSITVKPISTADKYSISVIDLFESKTKSPEDTPGAISTVTDGRIISQEDYDVFQASIEDLVTSIQLDASTISAVLSAANGMN